ncbi:hypothetical protein TNCV_2746541 [Trichonephila clavipes]|nr:hypothetical protein TNCV_2746541 [Trichonephila clavipes]
MQCEYSFNHGKGILEFVQSSECITDAHSDDDNKMNSIASALISSEMRILTKSIRNYLDTHSSGKMNNTIDDIEQFVDNLMLNKFQNAVAALKTKCRSQLNVEKELIVSISNRKPSFENLCTARQALGSR